MNKKKILFLVLVLFLIGSTLTFVGVAKAQDSLIAPMSRFIFPQVLAVFQHGIKATQAYADLIGDLHLTRSVFGSGGMGGSADGYTIHSTLGQPVAGSVSGGDYTLTSGFWGQALMEWFENFMPLILR